MTMKNNAKFEEEFTCCFKNDTKIWQILTRSIQCLKNVHFNGFFLNKVNKVWAKKVEELYFMAVKSDAKFDKTLTFDLENDMRNKADFHQSTWKSQNWGFDGILLSKEIKCMSLNIQRSYMPWQWRTMQNLKKNWLVVSKLTPQFDKFWHEQFNV